MTSELALSGQASVRCYDTTTQNLEFFVHQAMVCPDCLANHTLSAVFFLVIHAGTHHSLLDNRAHTRANPNHHWGLCLTLQPVVSRFDCLSTPDYATKWGRDAAAVVKFRRLSTHFCAAWDCDVKSVASSWLSGSQLMFNLFNPCFAAVETRQAPR